MQLFLYSNLMNKIKPGTYYLFRFFGWMFLLNRIFKLICYPINSLLNTGADNSLIVFVLQFIFELAILVLTFHISLEKVFFKPYKHIIITPSFSKITFEFTFKTFLKAIGATMGILVLVVFNKYCYCLLAFPILIFVQFYIIDKTVKRNATIALKL